MHKLIEDTNHNISVLETSLAKINSEKLQMEIDISRITEELKRKNTGKAPKASVEEVPK